jgi:hypothetical protein
MNRDSTLRVAVIVGAVVIVALAGGCNKSNSSPASTSTTAATATTAGSSRTTTPATTTTAASSVLFQQTGSGTASTPNFTTPTNWDIDWSYNCSNFGTQGNFAVTVEQAGTGTMASIEDLPINQLGESGSGVQSYHYGGKLYLSVDSECDWTIKAVRA